MRKLKLQMQITLDGFVAGPDGELDWMVFDDDSMCIEDELIDSSDTLLMGRGMLNEFMTYWTGVLDKPESPEFEFAKKMVDVPKIVFTKTLNESPWQNTTLAKGDLVEEVNAVKSTEGKDVLVYGGATFVANLIDAELIDEFYLFINPVAIGQGKRIFNGRKKMRLVDSNTRPSGVVINKFTPAKEADKYKGEKQ